MVESAIIFLVGFLCAALLAIALGPAVSRRAMRLAVARARLQSPLSEAQARAERDALRGKHAVETVKLETKLTRTEEKLAHALAREGLQATEALKLSENVNRLREEALKDETRIEGLTANQAALQTEMGAREQALLDMTAQRDRVQRELESSSERLNVMGTALDRNRVVIASLETRITQLNMDISDLKRSLAGASQDGLRQQKAFADRGSDLESRLAESERLREDMTLEVNRQLARLAEREAQLVALRTERDALSGQLVALVAGSKNREAGLAARLQDLVTSHATAEGALQSERKARLDMQSQIETLERRLSETEAQSDALAKGDQALRLSIARLGREMLKSREVESPGAPLVVNFTRREPVQNATPVADSDLKGEFLEGHSAIAGS